MLREEVADTSELADETAGFGIARRVFDPGREHVVRAAIGGQEASDLRDQIIGRAPGED